VVTGAVAKAGVVSRRQRVTTAPTSTSIDRACRSGGRPLADGRRVMMPPQCARLGAAHRTAPERPCVALVRE
jgi:hypothetical protein